MMAYYLDGQNLLKSKLHIGSVNKVRISSFEERLTMEIEKKYPHQDTVSIAKDAHFYGPQYVKGMTVSSGKCSGLPDF